MVASAILDPSISDDLWEVVAPEDFRDSLTRLVAKIVQAKTEKGVACDATLVAAELQELDRLGQWPSQTPPAAFIAEIVQRVPVVANWLAYAKEVRAAATLWRVFRAADQILAAATSKNADPDEVLGEAESLILDVGDQRLASQVRSLDDVLAETVQGIEERMTSGRAGVPTTFAGLDKILGGLRPGNMLTLAARPGRGKTSLALRMALRLSQPLPDGSPPLHVLFISLEMSRHELGERVLAAAAGLDAECIRDGFLNREQVGKLVQAQADLRGATLYVEDAPARTVANIAALCRRAKRRTGLDLVVIDYVQLIRPTNPRDPRQDQIQTITRALKELFRALGVPGVVLAQLNREAEKENKPPQLIHLRESGAIENDSDQVVMLHDAEGKDTAETVLAAYIRKNRHGPCGRVGLHWDKRRATIEDIKADDDSFAGNP